MKLAEKMIAALIGVDVDWWSRETASVAVEQTREMRDRYRAPHAMRGTPKRPKRRRNADKRLFTGQRP